jgi:hypothetical protein
MARIASLRKNRDIRIAEFPKTPNGARRRSPDLAVTADRRSPEVAKRPAIQETFGRN